MPLIEESTSSILGEQTESFANTQVHHGNHSCSPLQEEKHGEPTKVRLSFRLDLKMLPNSRWCLVYRGRLLRSSQLTKYFSTCRLTIHLRSVLREGSHQQAAVRLAAQEQLRRRDADREVEEAGI